MAVSCQRPATGSRVVAFYLPQFHPIPENDCWWGPGFTEWTNVRKALPLFAGHDQPKVPGELGYYDLRDANVRHEQARLARSYGVSAFCYYHYWFAGKRLLERPFTEVVASGEPDFPFCLCWANETWTGIWHGAHDRILIEQSYPGREDHIRHFNALLPAFCDRRYLTVFRKPLFLIYIPLGIPEVASVLDLWRELAVKHGLPGIYFVGIRGSTSRWQPTRDGFDASLTLSIPPYPAPGMVPRRITSGSNRVFCYDHAEIVDRLIAPEESAFLDFPCIGPNWDNSPRVGGRGIVLQNCRPELFQRNVRTAAKRVSGLKEEERLIFIKSWNEWAEGNYLEPDVRFGRGYLEALKNGLEEDGR